MTLRASLIYLRVRLYREYTMSVWIKNPQEKVRKNSLTKSRPDWCVVNCIFRLFGLLFYTFSNYKCCRGEGLSECLLLFKYFRCLLSFFPFFLFFTPALNNWCECVNPKILSYGAITITIMRGSSRFFSSILA